MSDSYDSGNNDAAITREIDTIVAQNPIGSDSYKQPAVQERLSRLYQMLSAREAGAPGADAEHASEVDYSGGPEPLGPISEPEPVESETVAEAKQTLQQMPGGVDLVHEWGADFEDNLAYARDAFHDFAQRYGLDDRTIRQVDGIGDNVAVMRHLAQHGRLIAGLRGTRRR
jgi:hypothetical protein